MPRRKSPSLPPDPATAALLQTLNPHAAGIDVGATDLWVCVPPTALVGEAGRRLQRIGKALGEMDVELPEVVSDITGVTGVGLVRAIVRGEREPKALARLRDRRCKASAAVIARALQGTWQPEHLFALQQSIALYDYYRDYSIFTGFWYGSR